MPFDREQPDPYNPRSRPPGAGDLNRIVRGGRRQITGEGVSEHGDRVVIVPQRQRTTIPSHSLFTQKFRVIAVYDNYLLCEVLELENDPDTGWWLPYTWDAGSFVPQYNHIYVAKPDELRRSYWDDQTLNINGVSTTYTYISATSRRAAVGVTATIENLVQPYYTGCIIEGIRTFTGLNSPPVAAVEAVGPIPARPAIGPSPISWTDANTAGRHWAIDSNWGAFVQVTEVPDPSGTVDDDFCPLTSAKLVTPEPGCDFPGNVTVFLMPLNAGEFVVGRRYRAWRVTPVSDTGTDLVSLYVANPDPEECTIQEIEQVCVLKSGGNVVDVRVLKVIRRGCTILYREWQTAPTCGDISLCLDMPTTFCLATGGFTGYFAAIYNNRQFVITGGCPHYSDEDASVNSAIMYLLSVNIYYGDDGTAYLDIGMNFGSAWFSYYSSSFGLTGGVFNLISSNPPTYGGGSTGGTAPATLTVSLPPCGFTPYCPTSTIFCLELVVSFGVFKWRMTYNGTESEETGWVGTLLSQPPTVSAPFSGTTFRAELLAIGPTGTATVVLHGDSAYAGGSSDHIAAVYEGSVSCGAGGVLSLISSFGKVTRFDLAGFGDYVEEDFPSTIILVPGECGTSSGTGTGSEGCPCPVGQTLYTQIPAIDFGGGDVSTPEDVTLSPVGDCTWVGALGSATLDMTGDPVTLTFEDGRGGFAIYSTPFPPFCDAQEMTLLSSSGQGTWPPTASYGVVP